MSIRKYLIAIFIWVALLDLLSFLVFFNWSPDLLSQFEPNLLIGMFTFVIFYFFNRNPDIWTRLLSGLIIGTFTLFISILFLLQEIKFPEEQFPVQVVMNENFHQPISLNLNSFSSKVEERYLTLDILASSPPIERPGSPDQTNNYLLDLLQYKIIKDMAKFQIVGSEIDQITPVNGITNIKSAVFAPYKPVDLRVMDSKDYLEAISKNPFSKTIIENEMQPNFWNIFGFRLPKRTKLSLSSAVSSEGVEQRNIIIMKPQYFKIIISVEPLAYGDLYSISPKLVDEPEMAKNCRTYNFVVKMNATFEKFTSKSLKTEQYIKWVQWLFNEIERVNIDKQSTSAVD